MHIFNQRNYVTALGFAKKRLYPAYSATSLVPRLTLSCGSFNIRDIFQNISRLAIQVHADGLKRS